MDTCGLFKPPDDSHLLTSTCGMGPYRDGRRGGHLIFSILGGDDSLHGHCPTYGGTSPPPLRDLLFAVFTLLLHLSSCSKGPCPPGSGTTALAGVRHLPELALPPSPAPPAAYSPTRLWLCMSHRQDGAVRGVTAQGLISVRKVSTKKANMLKAHILPVLSISSADEKRSRTAPAASGLSLHVS